MHYNQLKIDKAVIYCCNDTHDKSSIISFPQRVDIILCYLLVGMFEKKKDTTFHSRKSLYL